MSTAFDDLSSLSEDDEEFNEFKNLKVNDRNQCKDISKMTDKWTNHGLTSTPRLLDRSLNDHKQDFWTKSNGYQLNVSDIVEDDEQNECQLQDNNECHNNSDLCFNIKNCKINGQMDNNEDDNQRSELLEDNRNSSERSFSQRHVQLLIEENQRLSNELILCQQNLSTINGNYEGLQYKLKELNDINTEKENQLVKLEGKIRSLEMTIKVEKEAKEEVQRKLSVCESTIESLQYQLMQVERSDCLVRAQETNQSIINSLKTKHDKEVLLLRGEIEGLKHELNIKNNQICEMTKELGQKRSEHNENGFREQLKDMIQVTKELWEKEMKERVENDIKVILDLQQKKWTTNAEQEMINERNKWENDLQTEVFRLTEMLKIKAKVSAQSLPESISLRFVPLMNLWHALQDSYDSKEQALKVQINKLKEAKLELEEALNDSRHSHSSSPNGHSNEQILLQMRSELQKVSEEAIVMKQKLHKYKQHYHRLVRKHENEIQAIKEEFALILQTFKPKLN